MFVDCVFFCNFGVEVNEAVLKLVCKFVYDCYGSYKSGIVVFKNVFYGCMLFIVSVGGQLVYLQDFVLLLVDICYAVYNDINFVSVLIDDFICVVIVEFIQGEGGVVLVSNVFL